MHFLRLLSITAFGLGSLGISATARAGGGGDHENVSASHEGDAVVTERQSAAPPIGPPRHPDSRRDPSMFGWGLTMAITGGLSAITGVLVGTIGMGDAICFKWKDSDCSRQAEGQRLVNAGAAMAIAGSVLMGIGIPLAIVGGRRVGPPRSALERATLSPVVGPGHAGTALTLTF